MTRVDHSPGPAPVAHPCHRCGSMGIYYDPAVEAGRYGALKLCSCTDEECRCGGQAPYRYWDETGASRWCSCKPVRRRLAEASRLFKEAAIPERFRWKFQEDFQTTAPDGTPVPLAPMLQSYVSTLIDSGEEPRRGFLLHGPPGTGKTMLGCIMLNELILHRGKPGRFLNLSRTFYKLRDTFSAASEDYGKTWRILEEFCALPYLILDDFGIQRDTDWEKEMFYDLVDARYGAERFTVVTTNRPIDEIRQYSDGRIFSRLVEMCQVVEMAGSDYRMHLQSQR